MNYTCEGEWVDEDGYPTRWGLAQLCSFSGTPRELVEVIRSLWWPSTPIHVADQVSDYGDPVMQIRLATGGWSGNEAVIERLGNTFFSLLYWQASHRGGLHIYEVPTRDWDVPRQLGSLN